MNHKKIVAVTLASVAGTLIPALAFAAIAQNIIDVVDIIAVILNRVVGVSIILTMVWFVLGLAEYVSDESKDPVAGRKKGRERMVMGVITFFVIVSVWGLVRFLQTSIGIQGQSGNLHNNEIPAVGDQVIIR